MSLGDFIKKQFIDILQWTDQSDGVLMWRYPMADQEIQYGGSLTVREAQSAVFVNEGTVADVFGPGKHTLVTQTLPVLTYLKNWDKLFESPFKSDVYFVSTRQLLGRRWGTTAGAKANWTAAWPKTDCNRCTNRHQRPSQTNVDPDGEAAPPNSVCSQCCAGHGRGRARTCRMRRARVCTTKN